MDKRSPNDIRNSIRSLVEEAENVSVSETQEETDGISTKLDDMPPEVEQKYRPKKTKPSLSKQSNDIDLDLTGLISDDVALAVRAELMRFSDVFDTDDTKEIIYKSVTNATREMVREWLDQNLAAIAKEVINEALDKLSKNARN